MELLNAPALLDELKLPTVAERKAHHLRTKQGLSDAEIARVLNVRRETACRLRSRFTAKVDRIRDLCAGAGDCSMLAALAG